MSQDIAALRRQLQERMSKVPAGLGSASVQQVRDYKVRHAQASKLLGKKSINATELLSAIQSVS